MNYHIKRILKSLSLAFLFVLGIVALFAVGILVGCLTHPAIGILTMLFIAVFVFAYDVYY